MDGKKGIMMNRMTTVFGEMNEKNEKILVLYFPVGDTIFNDEDVKWSQTYFQNGATVLEIGLPYENPALDGKTIRDSMKRALSHTDVEKVFQTVNNIRKSCPNNILQIMTYYEIIEKYGIDRFAQICHDIDVDAVLAPNTPPEMLPVLDAALGKYDIYFLRFIPYQLNDEIIDDLKNNVKGGYIFQQAVDGATGEQKYVSDQIAKNVKRMKNSGVQAPICAGFGISNAKQAKEAVGMGADGIIIGSAVVNHIIAGEGEAFIKSIRSSIK